MELQLHTKAEGKYYFYEPTESGDLKLLGESDNLITNIGLEYVKTKKWTDCFTFLWLGSSDAVTAVPQSSALDQPIIKSGYPLYANGAPIHATTNPTNNAYANPGQTSYTFGDFNGPNITYTFVRTWQIANTSSADWVIKEVGTTPGATAPVAGVHTDPYLFSYSVLPNTQQVTVSASQTVIAMYELRLTTTSAFSGADLQLYTGGNSAYQIPTNVNGIVSAPYQLLKQQATVEYEADDTTKGNLLFEPSNTKYYGGYIENVAVTQTPAQCKADFLAKRVKFQDLTIDGPNIISNTEIGAVGVGTTAGYSIKPLGNAIGTTAATSHAFYQEPTTLGVYKTSYRLTTAPKTGEKYNGIVIVTAPTEITTANTFLNKTGWHCVFGTTWNRPANTYLELSITHTWS